MVKKIALVLTIVLALSGCSGLFGGYSSAQKIIDDLAYVGVCQSSSATPDSASQYGQMWARDQIRSCNLNFGDEACNIEVVAQVGEDAIAPTGQEEFHGEDYVSLAYVWGNGWRIGIFPNSWDQTEYQNFFRCGQIIRTAHDKLGGEVMTLNNFPLPEGEKSVVYLTRTQKADGFDYFDYETEEIAYRYLDANTLYCEKRTSKSCLFVQVIVTDQCDELTITYSGTNKAGKTLASGKVKKVYPTSFRAKRYELGLAKSKIAYMHVKDMSCKTYG